MDNKLKDIADRQYLWTLSPKGELVGLTAGDHGYENSQVLLSDVVFEAFIVLELKDPRFEELEVMLNNFVNSCIKVINE